MYLQIVPKKVSLEQFCALISQDVWLEFRTFSYNVPDPTMDKYQREAAWKVALEGPFHNAFGNALIDYVVKDYPIYKKDVFDNKLMNKLKDVAFKKVSDYLRPRWDTNLCVKSNSLYT